MAEEIVYTVNDTQEEVSIFIGSASGVDSVNGQTGVVVLDTDDIAEGSTNLYYTEARVSANTSVVANTAKVGVTVTAKVNEASGISIGDVVYISGATGGFAQVSLADNTDPAKGDPLAIAIETKANNQNIIIQTSGLLEGIDTSSFTEGDILYLSTTGSMTNVHPSGIDAVQRIGHAVKINASTGSILIELDPLTIINDHNGILRHQLQNSNTGTGASSAYTLVNDELHRASLSMVGSGYTVVAGIAESLIIYNEGYNKTVNAVDGNFGFEWWTDEGDNHNLSSTVKMTLSAEGKLTLVKGLEVGGEVDLNGHSIGGDVQSVTGTGATTVDWKLGNILNFRFGAFNETFTFTAPTKPGTFIIKLLQDSVGSRTATFPANVKWIGGTAPTLTTTATTGTDIITLYYDDTNYFGVEALNFS